MSKLVDPVRGYYFDDLEIGDVLQTGGVTVTDESIIDFAMDWDPQPFHIDQLAAQDSVFGQLVGSGLHTLMLTYRLYFDSGIFRGTAVAGLGIDDVRFLKPLVPSDTISVNITVTDKSLSKKPERGKMSIRLDTFNQERTHIFTMTINALVATRPRECM